MSYVVNVFRLPIGEPYLQNFEQALERTDRLFEEPPPAGDERAGANLQFRRFVAILTRRYPDITSPDAEERSEEELAWIDGPLDGDTDEAVYNLGLALERLQEVRPFVIESARRCGLGVRDDQAGEIYVTGRAFSTRGELGAPKPGPREAGMPDRFELLTIANDRLERVLARHGFGRTSTPDEAYGLTASRWFRRNFPWGWHELLLRTFVDESITLFELQLFTQFAPVTRLLKRIIGDGRLPDGIEKFATVALSQQDWLPDPKGLRLGEHGAYLVCTRAEIEMALAHLASSIESRLVPMLEQCQSADTFDALLNPIWHSPFFGGHYEHCLGPLGSAYLVNRPDFPAILDDFERGGREGRRRGSVFADIFEHLDKVVAWMRANPPPLR